MRILILLLQIKVVVLEEKWKTCGTRSKFIQSQNSFRSSFMLLWLRNSSQDRIIIAKSWRIFYNSEPDFSSPARAWIPNQKLPAKGLSCVAHKSRSSSPVVLLRGHTIYRSPCCPPIMFDICVHVVLDICLHMCLGDCLCRRPQRWQMVQSEDKIGLHDPIFLNPSVANIPTA